MAQSFYLQLNWSLLEHCHFLVCPDKTSKTAVKVVMKSASSTAPYRSIISPFHSVNTEVQSSHLSLALAVNSAYYRFCAAHRKVTEAAVSFHLAWPKGFRTQLKRISLSSLTHFQCVWGPGLYSTLNSVLPCLSVPFVSQTLKVALSPLKSFMALCIF